MKYVIVPNNIPIVNKVTGKVMKAIEGDHEQDFIFSMKFFVERYLAVSPKLLRARADEPSGDGLRRVTKLLRAFESCKEGDVIGVEDADYKAARAAVDALDWGPFAQFAPQVLPMIEAWEAAEKQDDEWKKKHDAERRERLTVVEAPRAG